MVIIHFSIVIIAFLEVNVKCSSQHCFPGVDASLFLLFLVSQGYEIIYDVYSSNAAVGDCNYSQESCDIYVVQCGRPSSYDLQILVKSINITHVPLYITI